MARKIHYSDKFLPDFGFDWVPPWTEEQMARVSTERLAQYAFDRGERERWAVSNPVGDGWVLPSWRTVNKNWNRYAIHVLLGGNQSGKSVYGSRLAVWAACTIPEAEVYCLHVSEKRSIDDQQRFVYEALSDGHRNLPTKKGIHHSLQYGQKNGFTDGICIVPPYPGYRRGGSIKFYNYAQYQQNDQILEGIKAHFVWLDEKVPLAMLNTLVYRLPTYHGRILLTYTVIDGWNDTIERILAKTKTLEWKHSARLGKDLPVMQESLSMDSCAIYYAWTDDNPFTDAAEFWKLNATADKATILARAYGIPTKSLSSAFPLFSRDVNVIAHEKLPWLNLKKNAKGAEVPYPVTRYMSIDLGGSKNWCMLWVAIDTRGTWWVYREWPDISHGDWALPGDKPGPAQQGLGYDIKGYVELIKQYEDGEKIFERFIDPRMGAAERQSKDRGAVTIISDLDECGLVVIPAPAASSDSDKGEIEDGIQLINNLLHYDAEKPIDSINSPQLYVSDRCQNFIYSMQEYTGKLGPKEHTKDFMDCFDFETEIFTEDGWVPFPELEQGKAVGTMDKDGYLEFQRPTEYHDYPYSGPMIFTENMAINFKVTPNHRMLVYPQRPYLKIRLAKDIYRQDTFPVTTQGIKDTGRTQIELWPGKIVEAVDWAEFMGWYVAEGSATGTKGGKIQIPGRGYSIYISQSATANPDKCKKIASVLERLNFTFGYRSGSMFSISSKDLWSILYPLGAQSERYIPREVLNLPRHCLEKMWEAMVLGDGWKAGTESHYSSISTRLIDDTSEILTKIGKPYGSIFVRNPESCNGIVNGRPIIGRMPVMMLAEKRLRVASVTNNKKEMLVDSVSYSGRIYCVSVPNETLVVRRNRKPLVTGNCLRYLRKGAAEFVDANVVDHNKTGVY